MAEIHGEQSVSQKGELLGDGDPCQQLVLMQGPTSGSSRPQLVGEVMSPAV